MTITKKKPTKRVATQPKPKGRPARSAKSAASASAGEVRRLKLDQVRFDADTQARAETNEGAVDEYCDLFRDGIEFPPVVVFFDGTHFWLSDGYHRWLGARRADLPTIEAEVRQGTKRDAILHAAGANAAHGLRRTAADKRRAVTLLLTDEEWREKSDRWIAKQCGVHHTFVGDMRRQLVSDTSCDEPAKRIGADGKARKLPTGKPKPTKPTPAASTTEAVEAPPAAEADELDQAIDEIAAGEEPATKFSELGGVAQSIAAQIKFLQRDVTGLPESLARTDALQKLTFASKLMRDVAALL